MLMVDEFNAFARCCEKLSLTKSKNEKIDILGVYLSELTDVSLPIAVLLLSGKIFPPDSTLSVNVAHRTIMSVLPTITDLELNKRKQDLSPARRFGVSCRIRIISKVYHPVGGLFPPYPTQHLRLIDKDS